MTEYKTRITYVANGTQKVFNIPFDYLRPLFIKVYIGDTTLTYGTDYLVADRQLTFTNIPVAGTILEIRRDTTTVALVSWHDASVLRAGDMTLSQVQQLHVLEEQQDWTKINSIYLEESRGWQAGFHRIINVGDPVEPQDAVTKQYVEDVKTGFIAEMITIKNSAITTITNLKTSTEAYITQLKDTFTTFVSNKTTEVTVLKDEVVDAATTATEQADRAQGIADNLEGLVGIAGRATTEEAIAGVVDNKAMTPLKTKEAVATQLQNKADLVDGKVPTEQLPEMDYVPSSVVGNEANKIPKYNASGHLVLPDGSEFWIG